MPKNKLQKITLGFPNLFQKKALRLTLGLLAFSGLFSFGDLGPLAAQVHLVRRAHRALNIQPLAPKAPVVIASIDKHPTCRQCAYEEAEKKNPGQVLNGVGPSSYFNPDTAQYFYGAFQKFLPPQVPFSPSPRVMQSPEKRHLLPNWLTVFHWLSLHNPENSAISSCAPDHEEVLTRTLLALEGIKSSFGSDTHDFKYFYVNQLHQALIQHKKSLYPDNSVVRYFMPRITRYFNKSIADYFYDRFLEIFREDVPDLSEMPRYLPTPEEIPNIQRNELVLHPPAPEEIPNIQRNKFLSNWLRVSHWLHVHYSKNLELYPSARAYRAQWSSVLGALRRLKASWRDFFPVGADEVCFYIEQLHQALYWHGQMLSLPPFEGEHSCGLESSGTPQNVKNTSPRIFRRHYTVSQNPASFSQIGAMNQDHGGSFVIPLQSPTPEKAKSEKTGWFKNLMGKVKDAFTDNDD